jgi:hypothetical protein
MNTHVRRTLVELGTFSTVVPLVWAVGALIGFFVLASWPEVFAEAAATAQVTVQGGETPSIAQPTAIATFER